MDKSSERCTNILTVHPDQTYMNSLQSGDEQMCDLCHLAESEARDRAGSLVQSQSFTVTISGDVTFSQNHAAVCEACRETQRPPSTGKSEPNSDYWEISLRLTDGHEVEVFMHAEARHFSRFVAGNRGENPRAQRIPAVSFVEVPHLHLKDKFTFSF